MTGYVLRNGLVSYSSQILENHEALVPANQ